MADAPTPLPDLVAIIRDVAESGDDLELTNADARQLLPLLPAALDPLGHAADVLIAAGANPPLTQAIVKFAAAARLRQTAKARRAS